MLKEAISYVYDAGEKSAKNLRAHIIDQMCDPRTIVFEHNGEIIMRDVEPPLRNHTVDSVEDLIAAAQVWGTTGVIWLSQQAAVLVTDDQDRREQVTLPLAFATVFDKLRSLNSHETARMDQATLIRLLRRELRKSPNASVLLAAVRKIKFRQASSGHSDFTHGNESMGNAIEAEVSGADDIADMLVVPTNIYSNPGEEQIVFQVTLDLEIDVQKQKFVLRPMPDEIDAAIAYALGAIKERLNEALGEKLVLFGKP